MRPTRRFVGTTQSPLVVIDGFSGDLPAIVDAAAALAPFPAAGNYYPGLRRVIAERDGAAWSYVERTMRAVGPFVGGGFDADHFDLVEASFSMVTAAPEALQPLQRSPHFDSTDPDYLAVLHYLAPTPGTAFYRQRATGIEQVDEGNVATFIAEARRATSSGYITGSNAAFEQIAAVEGVADRLVIYRGSLLHSGLIPPGMSFSTDPRVGRLTANFFIKAYRA